MTDAEIVHRIDLLEIRLRKIVVDYKILVEKIKIIESENDILKNNLLEKNNQNIELSKTINEQNKALKKANKFSKIDSTNLKSADSTGELKRKIDEYISDIEKCIDQLSN
ncbi:MAG: hypothetical protein KA313_07130 [Pseudarcicella sp.]|nr:hypothetical protein [Pseudarcicella sp.]MBP6410854.1 hypothetical protein [Pseudarcicella sp.]